jgi:hypothetical protein
MCEISNQLKFCTCLDEKIIESINIQKRLDKFHKNQLPKSNEPFSWILYEYKGIQDSGLEMMGLLYMPSDKIGFGLTEEFVLNEINDKNCFDFNYHPKEGDNLQINFQRNKDWTECLSFIFRNEKWESDSYHTFIQIIEPINFGILKVNK